MAYTPGKQQYSKSKVTQTSSSSNSSTGGSSSGSKTIAVNPLTYQPDPTSTFRVDSSQVGNPPTNNTLDTQSIGGSSGNSFQTSNGKVGYASSGVSEIREGGRDSKGYVIATNKPIINVSQSLANKIINERNTDSSSSKKQEGFVDKEVVLSVKERKKGTPPQSINYSYTRPKENDTRLFGKSNNQNLRSNSNNINNLQSEKTLSKEKSEKSLIGDTSSLFIKRNDPEGFNVTSQEKALNKYEESVKKRSKNLNDFSIDIIKNSPFRNGEELTFFEELGAKGLFSSARLVTQYPEEFVIVGSRGIIGTEKFFSQSKREESKQEASTFVKNIIPNLKTQFNPTTSVGIINIAEAIATPSIVNEISIGAKNLYVKTGSKFVAPENVFDVGVLEGKTRFPETSSIEESMKRFKAQTTSEGKILVQTSSDRPIGGDIVGEGLRARKNVEDSGIYVTPATEGSPNFLGTGKKQGYSLSVNPFKEITKRPTVTEFEVNDVVRLPDAVISKAGFQSVKEYQESTLSKQGVAQITKRSELGQRAIAIDYSIEGKNKFGTTEIEAVIPKGSKFIYDAKTGIARLKGFDRYTIVDGEAVAIRRARVVGANEVVDINIAREKILSGNKLASESEYNYSYKSKKPVNVSSLLSSAGSSGSRSFGGSSSKVSGSSSLSSSSVVSDLGLSTQSSSSSKSSNVSSLIKSSSSSSSSRISSRGKSSGSSNSVIDIVGSSDSNITGRTVKASASNKSLVPFPSLKNDSLKNYGVVIRREGKFRNVAKGLTFEQAESLGKRLVGGSAAATYGITRRGKVVDAQVNDSRFYQKGNVAIEKNKFRINTGGELKQITRLGIVSNRKNNRRGLII